MMMVELLRQIALPVSTGVFLLGLGSLIFLGVRAHRRSKRIHEEMDAACVEVAQSAQRRYKRRYGRANTKLDMLITEAASSLGGNGQSFSPPPPSGKLRGG